MKTRTTRTAKGSIKTEAEALEATKTTAPKVQLGLDAANPLQLFILPESLSSEARIVSIQSPRHGQESRYVVCPDRGFYEFTKVAAPKTTPRSWLLSVEDLDEQLIGTRMLKSKAEPKGYVTKGADLFIATPIDPLFLLLSSLAPPSTTKGSMDSKKLFLSSEDYIKRIESASPAIQGLIQASNIKSSLETRIAAVCETVDAGDETMYRLDDEKLLHELLRKAKKMIVDGLPASLEEKFVRKALEKPLLSKRRDEILMDRVPVGEALTTPDTESLDTQTTISSSDTAASSSSETITAATSFSENDALDHTAPKSITDLPRIDAPEGVTELLRLRTAIFFICSNYVQPHLTEAIKKMLGRKSSSLDFGPLDTHLEHLASLRKEALASRAFGDVSRKRFLDDDDEGEVESRAEKKRKQEEEEKRKRAGESRGVKNLKKVNVSGMKKMSDFFKKK